MGVCQGNGDDMDDKTRLYFITVLTQSIEKNAYSLRKQLHEYTYMTLTESQLATLTQLEIDLHLLVKEITR